MTRVTVDKEEGEGVGEGEREEREWDRRGWADLC